MKPAIAITVGDCNGIGPEVALRSILHPQVRRMCTPVLVGPAEAFAFYARLYKLPVDIWPADTSAARLETRQRNGRIAVPCLISSILSPSAIKPGSLTRTAGLCAANAIRMAVQLAQAGTVDALVTAPVSKHAMHMAGETVPGQTEMVRDLSHSNHVAMMLVTEGLRVGLVTIHIPVSRVARSITRDLVMERIATIAEALQVDWALRRPTLAVLALNPHAGEQGDIGTEEDRVITPALQALRRKGLKLAGPFPADAFFARYKPGDYDAVVAMYHDQGLIPLKMAAAGKAVNISVGLSVVRTSPDHGTAFDIAGKGKADASSMLEAIRLAVTVASNRRRLNRRKG